jgi:SAM-dependent methyltransferase
VRRRQPLMGRRWAAHHRCALKPKRGLFLCMPHVNGTAGYSAATEQFITATLAIDFLELHRALLPFIPSAPSCILDVGAGIGRDASVLSDLGHVVIAVEPTAAFRAAGQSRYPSSNITWLDDSLPRLAVLGHQPEQFDVVLASAVWHHLSALEQQLALVRVSTLLRANGVLALSLRHGPAGVGTHVFATDGQQTIDDAAACGLTPRVQLRNQPSLLPGKEAVTWTKLVFQKASR